VEASVGDWQLEPVSRAGRRLLGSVQALWYSGTDSSAAVVA
jgi:hypothetical protein